MAIKKRYCGLVYKGLLAEFNATTHVYDLGTIMMPTDSDELRVSNGVDKFSDLISIPAQARVKAAKVTALGVTTDLTAVTAVFADLAAAQSAVATLASDTEARLDAIEAKIDETLAKLKTANLMESV